MKNSKNNANGQEVVMINSQKELDKFTKNAKCVIFIAGKRGEETQFPLVLGEKENGGWEVIEVEVPVPVEVKAKVEVKTEEAGMQVEFGKSVKELIQTLSTTFGLSARELTDNGDDKAKIYIGRKSYNVTFGERFIRLAKDGKKIQIAYKSKKNTVNRLTKRLVDFK